MYVLGPDPFSLGPKNQDVFRTRRTVVSSLVEYLPLRQFLGS